MTETFRLHRDNPFRTAADHEEEARRLVALATSAARMWNGDRAFVDRCLADARRYAEMARILDGLERMHCG